MDEQTANDSINFEASDFLPDQTEEVEQEPTVEETNEQSAGENEGAELENESTEKQTDDSQPDEVSEFLAKKGVNLDDPDAVRKVAEMYRNAEKGFHQKSQEKAQLERQLAQAKPQELDPNQQALSEVRKMKTEMSVNKWKTERNLTPEAEQKMTEWAAQPLTDNEGNIVINHATGQPLVKGLLIVNGALSLDDAYRLAGADAIKTDDIKAKLKDEVRKEMATRQTAKRPVAGATNSAQFSKPDEDDPFVKALLG